MTAECAASWSVALEMQAVLARAAATLGERLAAAGRPASGGLLAVAGDTRQTAALVADGVCYGEPYWWSRELCGLLEATAPAIPDFTLRASDLVTSRGFVWFDRPLAMPPDEGAGFDGGLCALSWTVVDYYQTRDGRSPRVTYGAPRGAVAQDLGVVFGFYVLAAPGDPTLLAATSWFEGEALSGLLPQGRPGEGEWVTASARYVAAALSFLTQQIVVPVVERATRGVRGRVAAELGRETVRVIRLRRAAGHAAAQGEGEPVEWTCRWLVRGHWRQQACGKGLRERRPVFVLPHVKGPQGLPLKTPAARVFAVVR